MSRPYEVAVAQRFGDLGVAVCRVEAHVLVIWLYPVDGKLSVVEVEIVALALDHLTGWAEELGRDLSAEARARTIRFQSAPPEGLARATLLSIPYQRLIAEFVSNAADADNEFARHANSLAGALARPNDVEPQDRHLLEPLRDALTYVSALADGRRNPGWAVANDRDISLKSAQDRIWLARKKHGLLSAPSVPGVAGGELSLKALRLLTKLEELE